MIQCNECKAKDSIYFEGVVILPVGEWIDDNSEILHYWDWDNADMIDERGYFCRDCDASYLDPSEFVVQASTETPLSL